MGRQDRLAGTAWWSAFVLCGLVVTGHFFLLQVNNMPLSPLKLEMINFLSRYVNPYFVQHWNFFAPHPPTEDTWVLARAKLDPLVGGHGAEATPWINITKPLVGAVARDRFTPLFLVEIGLSNAATAFMNRAGKEPRATHRRNGKSYLKAALPAGVDPADMEYLRRTALASLEIRFPRRGIQQVQISFEIYRYPRFTRRNGPAPASRPALVTTPWAPARWVTPYCCVPSSPARR